MTRAQRAMTTVAVEWVATCSETLPWRKHDAGAEAARTDDEVVATRLGDVLDRRGGIAGSFDDDQLDAVLLEDPLRLGQLGTMGDHVHRQGRSARGRDGTG